MRLEKQRLKLVEEEQEKAVKQRIQNRRGTPTDTKFLKIKEITLKLPDSFHGGHIETVAYYVERME